MDSHHDRQWNKAMNGTLLWIPDSQAFRKKVTVNTYRHYGESLPTMGDQWKSSGSQGWYTLTLAQGNLWYNTYGRLWDQSRSETGVSVIATFIHNTKNIINRPIHWTFTESLEDLGFTDDKALLLHIQKLYFLSNVSSVELLFRQTIVVSTPSRHKSQGLVWKADRP